MLPPAACGPMAAKPHPSLVGYGMPDGPLRRYSKRRLFQARGCWGPLISASLGHKTASQTPLPPTHLRFQSFSWRRRLGLGPVPSLHLYPSPTASEPEGWTYHRIFREEKLAMGTLSSLPMSQDQAWLSPTQASYRLTMHSLRLLRAPWRDFPGRGLSQGAVPGEGLCEGRGFWPPGSLLTGLCAGGLTTGTVWLCIGAGRRKERVGERGALQFTSHPHCALPITASSRPRRSGAERVIL